MRRLAVAAAAAAGLLALAPAALAAPPSAPDLDPGSDSGGSSSDNVTSVTTPTFTVAGGEVGSYLVLCSLAGGAVGTPTIEDALLVTTPAEAAGVSLAIAGPLADGTWLITARNAASASCASGESSPPLTLVIDTQPPAVLAPRLVDFVGSNQSLTFTPNPRFDVFAPTGSTVTLHRGSTAIGTGTSLAGVARVRVSTPLADGLHAIVATATDLAGNTSLPSAETAFTVDATPASASSPWLLADDGSVSAESFTTSPRPRFGVLSEARARVTVYEDGLALGSATAGDDGVAVVRVAESLWLDPGVHCIYAVALDPLGNAGDASPELCVTIAPGVPPFTSNLGVALGPESLALTLRSSLRATASVRVLRGGRVVARATRRLAAGQRARVKVRLPRAAKGRLVVVATIRSADERKRVVRRVVVRR